MKFGIWLALGVVVWLWLGHSRRQRLRARGQGMPPGPARPAAPAAIEHILACRHCGLHVPASDAVVTAAGASFCCEAHRRLHPAA